MKQDSCSKGMLIILCLTMSAAAWGQGAPPERYYPKANELAAKGKWEAAEAYYLRALRTRGWAKDDPQKEGERYGKFYAYFPNRELGWVYYNLWKQSGNLDLIKEETNGALKWLNQSGPDTARKHYLIGLCYAALEDVNKAQAELEAAQKIKYTPKGDVNKPKLDELKKMLEAEIERVKQNRPAELTPVLPPEIALEQTVFENTLDVELRGRIRHLGERKVSRLVITAPGLKPVEVLLTAQGAEKKKGVQKKPKPTEPALAKESADVPFTAKIHFNTFGTYRLEIQAPEAPEVFRAVEVTLRDTLPPKVQIQSIERELSIAPEQVTTPLTITGTATDNDRVEKIEVRVDNDPTPFVITPDQPGPNVHFEGQIPLVEGQHTVQVVVVDASGIRSDSLSAPRFVVAVRPALVPVVLLEQTEFYNDRRIELRGKVQHTKVERIRIEVEGVAPLEAKVRQDGSFTQPILLPRFGRFKMSVSSPDTPALKRMEAILMLYDRQKPEVVLEEGLPTNLTLQADQKATPLRLSGIARDNDRVQQVEVLVDGKPAEQAPAQVQMADGAVRFSTEVLLGEGGHIIQLVATDPSGNRSLPTERSRHVVLVERKVPEPFIVIGQTDFANERRVKLTGKVFNAKPAKVSLVRVQVQGLPPQEAVVGEDGSFAVDVSLPQFGEFPLSVVAVGEPKVIWQERPLVLKDTLPPTLTLTGKPPRIIELAGGEETASVLIEGTAQDNDAVRRVRVRVARQADPKAYIKEEAARLQPQAGTPVTFAHKLSLPKGAYLIAIVAYDASGNPSGQQSVDVLVKSLSLPPVSLTVQPMSDAVGRDRVALMGLVQGAASFYVWLNDQQVHTEKVSDPNAVSPIKVEVAPLKPGENVIAIEASPAGGGKPQRQELSVYYDIFLPKIEIANINELKKKSPAAKRRLRAEALDDFKVSEVKVFLNDQEVTLEPATSASEEVQGGEPKARSILTYSKSVGIVKREKVEVKVRDALPFEVELELAEGENVVQIKALDLAGNLSFQEFSIFRGEPPRPYGESHALLIGINKYKNLPPKLQLNFAVKDVESIKELLISRFGFKEQNIMVLTDEKATEENIEKALNQLKSQTKVKPNDRVLVFFSGHGHALTLGGNRPAGVLVAHDAEIDFEDPNNYPDNCPRMDIIWKELSESCPAKHVLMLLDCCFSGAAVAELPDLRLDLMEAQIEEQTLDLPAHITKFLQRPVRQLIAASAHIEQAWESPEWGHSAFTYTLLKGLMNGEADLNKDGFITGGELGTYLEGEVPKLNNATQIPSPKKWGEGNFVFIHAEEGER